jgi:diketogulonate reductase-like aldo/keto reductase
MKQLPNPERRRFLYTLSSVTAAGMLWPFPALTKNSTLISKAIPSSGEKIPVIGLGSSITFNVGDDPVARDGCANVIQNFFKVGGKLIDSSPMYGSSQEVIGYALRKLKKTSEVFSADKVWISNHNEGREQMEASRQYWNVKKFSLMQVHNLVSWEEHLETLYEMKKAGEIRYVGITTSHGRRHSEFEKVMRNQPLDFVQLSYNIVDREAEQRLLPLARERGIAVIVNRPFQRGDLIDWAKMYPLPDWSKEIDCSNWAQFLLKFIVSHPAVTCAIPATRRVDHVLENMGAALGQLPDDAMRRKMVAYVEKL